MIPKGFHQVDRINYFVTFSTIVKHILVRFIHSLSLSKVWSLRQLNVYSAFLNGELEEVVYMIQLLSAYKTLKLP